MLTLSVANCCPPYRAWSCGKSKAKTKIVKKYFLVFWCRLASSRKSAQTISIQEESEERAAMADTIPLGQPLQSRFNARVESVPWPIWCMIAGITSSLIGGHWDISWHMSIGRDTFWTPAHIMIQMNGVLV